MNDPRPPGPPDYKLYRARRNPLAGLRRSGDLDALRRRLGRHGERGPDEPAPRRPLTVGRILKWVALAVAGWLLLSLVLFLISAQLEQGVSDSSERGLAGGGSLLTGSTILVLGSDARGGESLDTSEDVGRADSIMLVRAGFGSVRKLSIPRDAFAEIPGHSAQKINAAYALGGGGLMIETVERYLGNGLEVNHLIEVDFEDFPKLIDALGGITVDVERRICAPPFDNFWKGFDLPAGEQRLDGTKALGFARVRKNPCAPSETDIDRAARQQQVLSGIRGSLVSPLTFVRLPLVSWRAPQTLRTDMRGPGLLALFADLATSGSGTTEVLEPSCLACGPGSSLLVSEGARAEAVDELLGR